MKVRDICKALEQFAPLPLQEDYDNSGLLVGDPDMEVGSALITLDVTEEVVDECLQKKSQMIISHHPLIFGGLKRLTGSGDAERSVIKAVKNDIAVYSVHTNLDNVIAGVNRMLSDKLGLENISILRPMQGSLRKLVTFCPTDHAEKVRQAVFEAGAGHIGNYDYCSYNLEGTGSFRAGDGADPFVGEKNKVHYERETRIETIFPAHLENRILKAMFGAHPYEEVAYDIYPLENADPSAGAGMIGDWNGDPGEESFVRHIKKVLGASTVRHSPFTGRKVKKIAVCGGSGSFLIKDAVRSGADAFITADVKYHQFFEPDGKLLLVDAGHYETEQFTRELIVKVLKEKFANFALLISEVNTNPVKYL